MTLKSSSGNARNTYNTLFLSIALYRALTLKYILFFTSQCGVPVFISIVSVSTLIYHILQSLFLFEY
jgi:hypothetical protein